MSAEQAQLNYGARARKLLEDASVTPGDHILVNTDGLAYQGILLPRFDVGDSESIILKLKSGYNIGIASSKVTAITFLNERTELSKFPEGKVKRKANLPSVSVVSTGGTILSKIDYVTGGVSMTMTPYEIFRAIPELEGLLNIRTVNQLFHLGSEELWIKQWRKLAETTAKTLNEGDDSGVIILHGTDTMGYSSAALSFFLKDLSRPVVFTGAQRSSDRASFDGAVNIIGAGIAATKLPIAEVGVVMHSGTSDEECTFIRGTRTRKMHTSRRDAFRSINEPPLALIHRNGDYKITNPRYRPRSESNTYADTEFEEKIALVKAYPGSNPEILDWYADKGYKGIIIEGTGLGHTPTETPSDEADRSWIPYLDRATQEGMFIGMTSQCIYGRVHPLVYRALRKISKANVVFLEDMIPETAYVKLGYVLGKQLDFKSTKKMMLTSLAGEISPTSDGNSFLI